MWLETQEATNQQANEPDVVVRAVAGAEPAVVVARAGDRHAAQVRAHADDDQVLQHFLFVFVRVGWF